MTRIVSYLLVAAVAVSLTRAAPFYRRGLEVVDDPYPSSYDHYPPHPNQRQTHYDAPSGYNTYAELSEFFPRSGSESRGLWQVLKSKIPKLRMPTLRRKKGYRRLAKGDRITLKQKFKDEDDEERAAVPRGRLGS